MNRGLISGIKQLFIPPSLGGGDAANDGALLGFDSSQPGGIKPVPAGTYDQAGLAAQAATAGAISALPSFYNKIVTYNDATLGTIRVVGMGSSVGLGPDGALDNTNSAVAWLGSQLNAKLNRLANMTLTPYNQSVTGSTITSGQQTDYATAKTNVGAAPDLLLLVYGMNDGTSPQYHLNQTYPGVYANGKILIRQAQEDGADVVICTSPHPNSALETWAPGGTVTYPSASQIPNSTVAQSIIAGDWSGNGTIINASYRHLRVNEALRQLAVDTGCVLIDVEKYWFAAVAKYGEAALFSTGQIVHPNLLGYQQSYQAAITDFVNGLTWATSRGAVHRKATFTAWTARSPLDGSAVGGNSAPLANTAETCAFWLEDTQTIDRVLAVIGVQSGNLDAGIYDSSGAGGAPGRQLCHSGSTACPAAGGVALTIPAVTLPPGKYYAAVSFDNGTAQLRYRTNAEEIAALTGIRYIAATAFPLPASVAGFGVNSSGTVFDLRVAKS